jgi:hypothetical protein
MSFISFTHKHYIPFWLLPGSKTSTPRIVEFKILVEAFLFYITMHLVSLTCSLKELFFLFCNFLHCPEDLKWVPSLKFTIYVLLVSKMHHKRFEKNWSSGYQDEVKYVPMFNRHYTSCLAPSRGQKPLLQGK